jgi:hypothetical protein
MVSTMAHTSSIPLDDLDIPNGISLHIIISLVIIIIINIIVMVVISIINIIIIS